MDQERSVRRVGKVAQQAMAVFADAEIVAVRSADDGLIYASLPHLCRALGLDVASQEERIEEHAVLTEGLCDFDLANRMCGITSYKVITQGQYPKAVAWLEKMIHENQ